MQLLFTAKGIPNVSGIYKLTISGKNYIGSSISCRNRLWCHKQELNKNKHYSKYLQNCFNKYGKKNLYFEIIYKWDIPPSQKELLEKEKYFIDLLNPEFNSILDPTTQNNAKTTSKVVYQYNLEGDFIKEWISCSEAERVLQLNGVSSCARGNVKGCKSIGNFIWSYNKIIPNKYINNSSKSKIKKVVVYNLEGYKITSYNSIADCVRDLFKSATFSVACATVSSICNNKQFSFNNYRFSYTDVPKLETTSFLKGFAVKQLDKDGNLIQLWDSWGDIKKYFNIAWSFNRQLKFQKSNYIKFHMIHNFIWEKV